MIDDIKLRMADEPEPEKNTLPRGVKAMMLGDRLIFLRRVGGQLVPLPETEQERLKNKHVL